MDEHTPPVVAHAETAYEAIRAINHLTVGAVPAPLLYDVLGNLKGVGHLLPQALTQLGRGLAGSLSAYDVYDGAGKDPAASVARARACLAEAGARAADLGRLLEAAQCAINEQGYHPAPDPARAGAPAAAGSRPPRPTCPAPRPASWPDRTGGAMVTGRRPPAPCRGGGAPGGSRSGSPGLVRPPDADRAVRAARTAGEPNHVRSR